MAQLVLKTAIGSYPHTRALKDGRVTSPRVKLDFVEFTPANRAFRPMANDLAFDVSELAIVTYFVAKGIGRPLTLLPVVMMCQPEFSLLITRPDSPLHTPKDLEGKTIGLRSYTQTTATWVRGMLSHGYGVDVRSFKWKTIEGSHLDDFKDPPEVVRMPSGTNLFEALKAGDIDASIIAWEARETPNIRPVFDNPLGMEAEWSRQNGILPINHLLCAKTEVLRANPWLADELTAMFKAAREAGESEAQPEGQGCGYWGLEANRPALDAMCQYAYEQAITPKRFSVDELFRA